MHTIFAFFVSLFLGFHSPAPVTHPIQPPRRTSTIVPNPVPKVANVTLSVNPEAPTQPPVVFAALQSKPVRAYFGRTLSDPAHKVDRTEKTTYLVDLDRLRGAYSQTGTPFNQPAFASYLKHRESKNSAIEKVLRNQNTTLDEVLAGDLARFGRFRVKGDPFKASVLVLAYLNSDSIRKWMSVAGRKVLSVTWQTLLWTFGPEYTRSYFGSVTNPIGSTLYSIGQKHFKFISIPMINMINRRRLRKHRNFLEVLFARRPSWKSKVEPLMAKGEIDDQDIDFLKSIDQQIEDNKNAPKAEATEDEMYRIDGLHAGTKEELDDFLENHLVDIFVRYHNTKASFLSNEAADGLESYTSNAHWREGSQVQLIGGIDTNAAAREFYGELMSLRAALLVSREVSECREAAYLIDELVDEHTRLWKGRLRLTDTPALSDGFKTLYRRIRAMGVRERDLAKILDQHRLALVSSERIAAGLVLQIIQDAAYKNHNRGLDLKIRLWQGMLRKRLNMGPYYAQHREAIERIFRELGAKITVSRHAEYASMVLTAENELAFEIPMPETKSDYLTSMKEECADRLIDAEEPRARHAQAAE